MRPRIVPPNLFAALIEFVTVRADNALVKVNKLLDAEDCLAGKVQVAFDSCSVNARANNCER